MTLLFLLMWTAQQPQMSVSDPSGKVHNTFSVEANSKMAYLQIPNTAKVGAWTYSLKSSAQTLTLTVTSHAENPNTTPIAVDSKMNKDTSTFPNPMIVYTEIRQGSLPIIEATVTPLIELPDGTTQTLELLDNGEAQQPQMSVSDASGKVYNTFSVDANFKMAHLQIPNTAKVT
ncbi:calcium-activated chloride channel regulator 1-like [Notamacropus eugenii]|uniref:calcium-activated chloride channel regulator 1-like n=1 Tax=Notamacropus eugenii TaxID=9315 RepID=UPI003B67B0A5